MSREIKFRAWDEKTNRMLDHNYLLNYSFKNVIKVYGENGRLMQYTGLKDKNGKEIWESDIVLTGGIHFEVYQHPSGDWQAGGLSIWEQSGEYSEENEWEVVGNVFEDSGLMEDNYGS